MKTWELDMMDDGGLKFAFPLRFAYSITCASEETTFRVPNDSIAGEDIYNRISGRGMR
jgi:hypothetical protein